MEPIVVLDETLVLDTTVTLANGYMVVIGTQVIALDESLLSELLYELDRPY